MGRPSWHSQGLAHLPRLQPPHALDIRVALGSEGPSPAVSHSRCFSSGTFTSHFVSTQAFQKQPSPCLAQGGR